jgi:prophage tail gpP-like protein
MSNNLRVIVDRQSFEGWKRVSVTRSIESLSGTFEITLLDKFGSNRWVFVPNITVDIAIGDDQVLRGLIDKISVRESATGKEYTISGRDETADLIDCSAMNTPGDFKDQTIVSLAQQLFSPFDIKVKNQYSGTLVKFPFKLQTGESPFEALNRANEFQGALLISDNLGRVIITQPGATNADDKLIMGNNIAEANMEVDFSNRFSVYTVKGQKKVKNDSGWGSVRKVNFSAEANDEVIGDRRYRPKLFQAEAQATQEAAQNRVNLEASVRASKSMEATVMTRGWHQSTGRLWTVNETVYVNIPEFQMTNRKMLIASLTHTKSLEEGTMTTIKLRREDAYQKLIKKAVRKGTVNSYGW